MRVAYHLGKLRQTDVDGSIGCHSLTPERGCHLNMIMIIKVSLLDSEKALANYVLVWWVRIHIIFQALTIAMMTILRFLWKHEDYDGNNTDNNIPMCRKVSNLWSRIANFWHLLSVADSTMLVMSPWRDSNDVRLPTRRLEVMNPEHTTSCLSDNFVSTALINCVQETKCVLQSEEF